MSVERGRCVRSPCDDPGRMPAVEEIAYLESQRALDMQTASLDELRGRTGYMLAAAGVISAFFGPVAFDDGIGLSGVLAIVAFAAVAGLCVYVLLPRFADEASGWIASNDAKIIVDEHVYVDVPDTPEELWQFLALWNATNSRANEKALQPLFKLYWLACILLAVDIGLWLLEIAVD